MRLFYRREGEDSESDKLFFDPRMRTGMHQAALRDKSPVILEEVEGMYRMEAGSTHLMPDPRYLRELVIQRNERRLSEELPDRTKQQVQPALVAVIASEVTHHEVELAA